MNGFKGALGTIAAIVVAVVLGVGGYEAYQWYKRDQAVLSDARQVVADSAIAVLRKAQDAADARRKAEKDSLVQEVAAAKASAAMADGAHAGTLEQLEAQRRRADSLQAAADSARAKGDTAGASAKGAEAAQAAVISLDSAIALVTTQHAKDAKATNDANAGLKRCTDLLSDCERGRIRADSIADWYKDKYDVEHAKERPRWERWSIEIGKAVAIAMLTRAIVK